MSTSGLNISFYVNSVSGSLDGSTKQNVTKRIVDIKYLESPPDDAARLTFVGSKEISPTANLFIGDRSDSLYPNSRAGRIEEFISETQPIDVTNTNFLVTQKFSNNETGIAVPLYYKHVIEYNSTAELIVGSVRLYDKDANSVSEDKYLLETKLVYDETSGSPTTTIKEYHLYNSLNNTFDQDTGEFEVFFVQYSTLESGNVIVYTELLSNSKAYKEATFADIWSLTGQLEPWCSAYTIDTIGLSVGLPVGGLYGVRYLEKKRLRVLPPAENNDTSPWYPIISNGSFKTGYGASGSQITYSYGIKEFSSQSFGPIEPYKIAARDQCLKISDSLIKLPYDDIVTGGIFSDLSISIYNEENTLLYAITNDTSKIGTAATGNEGQPIFDSVTGLSLLWSSDKLLGIDLLSGIVHLDISIRDSYKIFATFSYKESNFVVNSINMNPIFNSSIQDSIISLYIVPRSFAIGNSSQTESVKWVQVAKTGLITDSNQTSEDGNLEDLTADVSLLTADGYSITGGIGLHYNRRASSTIMFSGAISISAAIILTSTSSFPQSGWIRFLDENSIYRYAKYESKTDTNLILSSASAEVPSTSLFTLSDSTVELVNFIDERTTLSSRSPSDEMTYKHSSIDYPSSHSRYFVLADLTVNPPHSKEDLVVIDVRENGGGLINYEDSKAKNPKAQWLSDFGDYNGQIYPSNAAVVVKIPESFKLRFTEEEIEDIVASGVAFGVKPLIRYYGYVPNVISVVPETI